MKAPVSHSKDLDLQKAPQALIRASEKARQLAEQTGHRLSCANPLRLLLRLISENNSLDRFDDANKTIICPPQWLDVCTNDLHHLAR